MPTRPFPWASLPRVDRRAFESLSAVRASLDVPAVTRALSVFGDLSGTAVSVKATSGASSLGATRSGNTVSLRLRSPAASDWSWWMLLEAEPALVAEVVAHVTRRPPVRVLDPSALTPSLVGAFAAVVAAAVRRAGVPVVVAEARAGDPSGGLPLHEDVLALGFSITAFEAATHLRVFCPKALLAAVPRAPAASWVASLGALPLSLPVVACRTMATAVEVAALSLGDVWVLGTSWKLGPPSSPLAGPVWLSAPQSEAGVRADLEAGGRVVLREGFEELSWSPMDEASSENAALVEAVGEVPVVVRVEVGAARMTAREWGALRAGDVVALGATLGSPVTLRVSGLAVAEGDLVDVDGEVGVRIRRRLTAATP